MKGSTLESVIVTLIVAGTMAWGVWALAVTW